MIIGKSGSFELSGSNGITVRVTWTEFVDVVSNASVVQVSLEVKSSWYYGVVYYLTGFAKVGDEAVASFDSAVGTHNVNITALDAYAQVKASEGGDAPPWESSYIVHNADGSKSVKISVDLRGYTGSGDLGSGWSVSGSQTIELTHIPRASTVGASDANIGANSTIIVTRKSDAYTHSLQYVFGDLFGYITEAGGISDSEVIFSNTSISWAVPTTFYDQIPNAKNGTCTLIIRTYSGSTQIGEAQTGILTVTASVMECAPLVSGTVVDANEATKALTGDESKLVRYKSTALCTISAVPRNGATIAQKQIGGVDVVGDARTIEQFEASAVVFNAVDSRGYSSDAQPPFELIPYVLLTCNPEVKRTDGTSGNAVLTIKGNFYNGSFGAANNSLTLKYRIMPDGGTYGDYVSVTPALNGNTYSASVALSGLDYQNGFTFEVVAEDAIEPIVKTVPLGQGLPAWDIGKDHFRINVALRLLGASYGTSLPQTGKKGQVFFLLSGGSYTVKINDGTSWQ